MDEELEEFLLQQVQCTRGPAIARDAFGGCGGREGGCGLVPPLITMQQGQQYQPAS